MKTLGYCLLSFKKRCFGALLLCAALGGVQTVADANATPTSTSTSAPIPAHVNWVVRSISPVAAGSYAQLAMDAGGASLWIDGDQVMGAGVWAGEFESWRIEKAGDSPAPAVSKRRHTIQLTGSRHAEHVFDPVGRTHLFYRYDDSGLLVARLNADGQTQPILQARDPRLAQLFYDQSAGKLLPAGSDAFWVVNNWSGALLLVESKNAVGQVRECAEFSKQQDTSSGANSGASTGSRRPQFFASAGSVQGDLWLAFSDGMLRRIDKQCRVVASAPWPFAAVGPDVSPDLVRYGDGALFMSHAGVVAVSAERQRVASLGHDGQLLWQRSLCGPGLAPSGQCAIASVRAGFLSRFGTAVGQTSGAIVAADGQRLFRITGPSAQAQQQLLGQSVACTAIASQAANTPFVPCFDDAYRAARISPQRIVLASAADAQSHMIELALSPRSEGSGAAQTTQVRVLPWAKTPEQGPEQLRGPERVRVSLALHDARHAPYASYASYASSSGGGSRKELGLPAGDLLFDAQRLAKGARYLPFESGQDGHPLFFLRNQHTALRWGPDKILVQSVPFEEHVWWVFDIKRGLFLEQALLLRAPKANPFSATAAANSSAASSCEAGPSSLGHALRLFNDEDDRTLASDGQTGKLYELMPDQSLRLLGSFAPKTVERSAEAAACASARDAHVGVRHAARDGLGRLWLLLQDGSLSVQRGERFVPLAFAKNASPNAAAPQRPVRLLGSLGRDMLVLDADGVALITAEF
jgi:YD repeat-containing protein